MSKKQLILVASSKMDNNKKAERNENELIRMAKFARETMGLKDEVEVYPIGNVEDRLRGAVLLNIFQAFSSDVQSLKEAGYSDDDLKCVGFVTTKTLNRILGSKKAPAVDKKNIWISDTVTDTVIGADPEFLLFDKDGRVVRANSVLPHTGLLGADGAMAEIRPKPAVLVEEFVENIRSLFIDKALTDPISKFKWVSACYYKDNNRDYPIGGHIHIGNPSQVAKIDISRRVEFFKTFNKIMDQLLSIPLTRVDGPEMGKARRIECTMGKYGYYGGFRHDTGRLEHRTLSGMWLMHPKFTSMVLGTAKAIIDEVFKKVAESKFDTEYMFPSKFRHTNVWASDFNLWGEIPLAVDMDCTLTSASMLNTLHKSNLGKTGIKNWYKQITSLSTYNTYAKYIEGLAEVINMEHTVIEKFDKDIRKNWLGDAKFLI